MLNTFALRPYQTEGYAAVMAALGLDGQPRTHDSIVLRAECGYGKTAVAAAVIDAAWKQGRRCAFLSHTTVLLFQTSDAFNRFGLDHALYHGTHRKSYQDHPVLLTTPQTAAHGLPDSMNPPDLLVIDECHFEFKVSLALIKATREKGGIVLGLSATPTTEGMDAHYQTVIEPMTFMEMVNAKPPMLCKPEIWHTRASIDMSEKKVVAGEWTDGDVDDATTAEVIGDAVSQWETLRDRYAHGQAFPTIVNGRRVDTCERIATFFRDKGYEFSVISSRDPNTRDGYERRQRLFDQLAKGEIDGLISPKVLGVGFDCPPTRCVILANPYRSKGAALRGMHQFIGRGARVDASKRNFVVLDMAENMIRHYAAWWKLLNAGHSDLSNITSKKGKGDSEPAPVKACESCGKLNAIHAKSCKECGAPFPDVEEKPTFGEGELEQFAELDIRAISPAEMLANIGAYYWAIFGPHGHQVRNPKSKYTYNETAFIRRCRAAQKDLQTEFYGPYDHMEWGLIKARKPCNPTIHAMLQERYENWKAKQAPLEYPSNGNGRNGGAPRATNGLRILDAAARDRKARQRTTSAPRTPRLGR